MSDKTTALIERDRLSELIHATVDPPTSVSANTIPRALIDKGAPRDGDRSALEVTGVSISPVAVLLMLVMLVTLFVAIVRL